MKTSLAFREAEKADLPAIAGLLSDDALGAGRDGLQHLHAYAAALDAVRAQAGNSVIVAVMGGEVVGMLQLPGCPAAACCGPRSKACGSAADIVAGRSAMPCSNTPSAWPAPPAAG